MSDIILLIANILSGSELSEEQLIAADVVPGGTIDILVRCLGSGGGRVDDCFFFLKNKIGACGNHLCRMLLRLWISFCKYKTAAIAAAALERNI